jgi:phosphomannomutase
MTLIKSISGIRGTIGGKAGEGITPPDMVKYASAFGTWIKKKTASKKTVIVLGRDARISGDMAERLVSGTLAGLGIDVINLSLATTPTVEMAVQELKAGMP